MGRRISTTVFKSTPEFTATLQPFVTTPPLSKRGIILGIDLKTHRVVVLDPWDLKKRHLINGTMCRVSGEREAGKSTLLKTLFLRGMGRQAGVDEEGQPLTMRGVIDDRKPEAGVGEFDALTRELASETINLNQAGLINQYDPRMGMSVYDTLEMAIYSAEFAKGGLLTRYQPLAVQVAVDIMLTSQPEKASNERLEQILQGLTVEGVAAYYRAIDQSSLYKVLDEQPSLQKDLQLSPTIPHTVPAHEFAEDASLVATYFGRILRGDFGNIFGGQRSLRDLMRQPLSTYSWIGVPDKARTLLTATFMKWQNVAHANNDIDVIPHIRVSDEVRDAFDNLMTVRFYAERVRKARASHEFDISASQFEQSLNNAGEAGSELRGLARDINWGIGFRFIGRQPNDPDILEQYSRLGVSDQDCYQLTKLGQGCFGIKVPDREIVFYQHIITDLEAELVQTDSAVDRMETFAPTMSKEQVQLLARRNGVLEIGSDSHEFPKEAGL